MNGVRAYAERAGARVHYLPLDDELRLHDPVSRLAVLRRTHVGAGLVAFPAQSNFSGVQHPLALVDRARGLGYTVLLDAAAFVPTSPLSLRRIPADFVACSFYKMFGYPTGVGALIARREALARLRRPWFAGGAVEYVSVQHGSHLLREGAEGFEDGTVSFLDAEAVIRGLDFLDGVGMPRIRRHVWALASSLVERLRALTHADGSPMIRLYGPRDRYDCGGTVTFNVLDARGEAVPYELVEERARRAGVSVRGGASAIPGASEAGVRVRRRSHRELHRRDAARGMESGAVRAADACVRRGARDRRGQGVSRNCVERTGSGEAARGRRRLELASRTEGLRGSRRIERMHGQLLFGGPPRETPHGGPQKLCRCSCILSIRSDPLEPSVLFASRSG